MQIALAGFVTKYALIGGTKHLYYLESQEVTEILKWNYVLQCWGILAFTPAKISVGLLINRIMRPFRGWRFWVLIVSLTLLTVFNVLNSIFTYVQCNPAQALWQRCKVFKSTYKLARLRFWLVHSGSSISRL